MNDIEASALRHAYEAGSLRNHRRIVHVLSEPERDQAKQAGRRSALEDSANLPAPEVIAMEITEDLEAPLAQFAEWSRRDASDIDGQAKRPK